MRWLLVLVLSSCAPRIVRVAALSPEQASAAALKRKEIATVEARLETMRSELRAIDPSAPTPVTHRVELVNARSVATCWVASTANVSPLPEMPDVTEPDDVHSSRVWAHRRDVLALVAHVKDLDQAFEQMRECLGRVANVMD